ncbi:hypothetical protein [Lentibacter sp.]|uniref:hypothetical protein n=1 Tax=Lentibacter sp. TaxID=2024994 RepID=UPI003F6B6C21
MKAIAEYFRDLAADDRYFGAEPPSPDAEMLARIAEREISRRVEAHRDKDTFVLRADPSSMLPMAAKAPAEPAPAPHAKAQPVSQDEAAAITGLSALVAESQSSSDADDTLAAPEAEPFVPKAKAPADPDSVAAKLQRIRDVVSKGEAENAYSEDEHAEDTLLDDDAATEAFLTGAQADITAALDADDAAEDAARAQAEKEAEAKAAEQARAQAAAEAEAEAKAKAEAEAKAKAEAEAKAKAQAKAEAEATARAEAKAQAEAKAAADEHARTEAAAAKAKAEKAEAEAAAQAKAAEDASVFDLEDDAEEEDDISAMLERLSATDSAGETDPANDAPQDEPFVGDDDVTDAAPVDASMRARVIKMKKSDFEAAISDGYIEEEDSSFDHGEESTLSHEEEEELMRELAAVEAELASHKAPAKPVQSAFDDADEEDAFEDDLAENAFDDDSIGEDTAGNLFSEDDPQTDANVSSTVRAMRSARLTETASDDQMGRILEETNTKLNEDEGRGRRNAIAHLRAAVQATEAERDLGGDLGADGRDTEVYRDDLETAVRPRRPVAAQTTGTRPEMRRPAPLKLVAEQRIDTPKPDAPVRPRRVRVTQKLVHDKIPEAADGFADYAESVGAQNLGEVLEAAASFMSFVEGQDAFSRPQLMSKLKGTDHANTSREDRLRSFGQLLRAGKIRKLGGGQFKASEEISYRPSARAAGS